MPLEHRPRAIHLKPATELAERVLLPGDPHRALRVAQALLDGPRMFNHSRGLWGYTGMAADGGLLTIQATGIGGPSAAIVAEELIALGARRFVRVGTCGALDEQLRLGDLVAAETVVPGDGASLALGADGVLFPERGLLERLVADGAQPVRVLTTDVFYADARAALAGGRSDAPGVRGVAVVEMEAATILQVAARRGVDAACVLGVTDVPSAHGAVRASRGQIEEIGLRVGEAGYRALAASAA